MGDFCDFDSVFFSLREGTNLVPFMELRGFFVDQKILLSGLLDLKLNEFEVGKIFVVCSDDTINSFVLGAQILNIGISDFLHLDKLYQDLLKLY